MAKTVIVSGAGVSAHAKVPIMNSFLDRAEELYWNSPDSPDLAKFKQVFEVMSSLQLIQSKAQFDLKNIESVFAAIEFAKLINAQNEFDVDLNELSNSINTLIVKTIELTSEFVIQEYKVTATHPYPEFVELVIRYKKKDQRNTIAIITFNYDVVLDLAIVGKEYFCDYGLDTYKATPSIPILKLHGSINWGKCPKCNSINPWPIDEYVRTKESAIINERTNRIKIRPGTAISVRICPTCNYALENRPFIVPPTWNKTQYHMAISDVWSNAAAHLREAENVFVVGYSLPDTDYFFRYLYSIGTMGKTRLKNFIVCNPDRSVDNKFQSMLGQQAVDRYRFVKEQFSAALAIMRTILGL
jgi:NAD-dependent SIR2 family protein deacetylase